MIQLKQPASAPEMINPLRSKMESSEIRPQFGEFDKELKKKVFDEQQMIQAALLMPQMSDQQITQLPVGLIQENAATQSLTTGGSAPIIPGNSLQTQSAPSQSIDQLLTAVPIQPSKNGKAQLLPGMKSVSAEESLSLTPAQLQQLEALNSDSKEILVSTPETKQTPAEKLKKSLSSDDFLSARIGQNVNSSKADAVRTNDSKAQSVIDGKTISGLGMQGIVSTKENQGSSSDKKDSNREQDQLSRLSQGLTHAPVMAKVATFDPNSVAPTQNANVVPGSLGTQRLSHDSIVNMGAQIQSFSGTQAGGEMKLRLKPDQLGEVFIQVSTMGNKVDLKVRASDDNAKKIIEESLSALKDQLSTHQLSLGSIDVATAPSGAGNSVAVSSDSQQFQNSTFQQTDLTGQNSQSREWNERQSAQQSEEKQTSALTAAGLKRMQAQQSGMSGSGRLNVLA